jgi:hypothetical protein
MAGETNLELNRPRSIWELVVTAFELYRRVPVLFLALAAIVVIPYEVIVLAITQKGPLAQGQMAFLPRQLLLGVDSFLVTPLISALHVHAVSEVGDGRRPSVASALRRSLPTLPTVAIAAGVSSVAITIGGLVVVPGLILAAIWAVVAQAAALERGSWIGALRRSAQLTRGYRWHALGLVLVAGLIAGVPWLPTWFAFRHSATTGVSFAIGAAAQVFLRSFEALITALLYFDLKSRFGVVPKAGPAHYEPRSTSGRTVPPSGHPLDPDSWSDEERPSGWYVDPGAPEKMHYWVADGAGTWSMRTAKTPKATLAEWNDLQFGREREGDSA